ncbi:uncharacterized protein LOC120515631 isoform X2 [Polypterus senegalus]|uniref:uncharacterized protein LOC120515631 isoform X2 n=1 Tax=Polypterus senegalus TaxID=55291 RepID=UPI001964AD89|nr:uncharacterized protein LOC120515631 isoform X2 [Polypterus senegalus]
MRMKSQLNEVFCNTVDTRLDKQDLTHKEGSGYKSTSYAEDAKSKQFDKAQQEKQQMQREIQDLRRCVQANETKTEKVMQENKALQKEVNEYKKRLKITALKQMRFSGVTSENLNDPYRETELMKMYNNLKQSWLILREQALQSRKRTSEEINILGAQILQKSFQVSQDYINKTMDSIQQLLLLDPCDPQDGIFQQVCKNNKQILQKQLSFRDRHSYQDELKKIYTDYNLQNPGDSCFQGFVAECFKVASLMFLHEPPLSPNWNIPLQKDKMIFPAITNGFSELYPAEIVSYSLDKNEEPIYERFIVGRLE